MPLLPAKCPICGAILKIESEKEAALCPSCNNAYVVERAINNYNTYNSTNINADTVVVQNESEKEQLIKSGETYIKLGSFEKANKYYEQLVEKYPDDYRGWWGLIRCCLSCGRCNTTKDYEIFHQIRETERIMGILEKLAPAEVYIEYKLEYKLIVDQFLHFHAQENAAFAAVRRKRAASIKKAELEKQIVVTRANIEKLKEIVNTEDLRIEKEKREYVHKTDLINQGHIVDTVRFSTSNDAIDAYNLCVNAVNKAQSNYEQAEKKILPYKVFLGIGIAFAVLGTLAVESFILAIIFLWLYWGPGDDSRRKYKKAREEFTDAYAVLSSCADKAKDKLKKEYERYVTAIRKGAEESREDIDHREEELALQEEEIQKCEKLLNFNDNEIQKFYLSVWHQRFKLESISYDERLNELLSSERLN